MSICVYIYTYIHKYMILLHRYVVLCKKIKSVFLYICQFCCCCLYRKYICYKTHHLYIVYIGLPARTKYHLIFNKCCSCETTWQVRRGFVVRRDESSRGGDGARSNTDIKHEPNICVCDITDQRGEYK